MKTPWTRLVRSPVAQFLVTGLLASSAVLAVSSILSNRAAHNEALADARATTEVLARSVAEPGLPRGLAGANSQAVARFDHLAHQRLLVHDVRRIKIWAADGTIVYSDEPRLIGDRFRLGQDERQVLTRGGSQAELSDLTRPENRYERPDGGLVEVYTPIRSPEGQPLLFEAYYTLRHVAARQAEVIGPFQRVTFGALAAMMVVATALLWGLTRRASRDAADRERLLRSAASASTAERRRIARDLHDGVVQDLAGSAFTISALGRQTAQEPVRSTLLETAASLRRSLRSLRSLLVEIHPPDLTASSLPAALADLTAPAAAAGIQVDLEVDEHLHADNRTVALVWRVAQEAVRNTTRHADASRLSVLVHHSDGKVLLTVADDGAGFDPASVRPTAHYGLRGLTSLVDDAGGALSVDSRPGTGTTVGMEVPT